MPLLEVDKEEVKEGKELKILTPNKLVINQTSSIISTNKTWK